MTSATVSRAHLSAWLTATSNADVTSGLSRPQALIRAEQLRRELVALRFREARPLNLDEDSKDVVYALVELLEAEGSGRRSDAFAEANTAYRYLAESTWAPDEFSERRDLMRRCARQAWRALGVDIETIHAVRRNPGPGQCVAFRLPDSLRPESPGLFGRADHARELTKLQHSKPAAVAARLASLYEEHERSPERKILDVTDYISGAIALQAGGVFRVIGATDNAEAWLNRAEKHFSATTDPVALCVRVLVERLALMFGRRQAREACEIAPRLISETRALGMHRDLLRVRLVYAACLRVRGLSGRAIDELSALKAELDPAMEPMILISTLSNLADALVAEGRFPEAASVIEKAYQVGLDCGPTLGMPRLGAIAGQLFRRQGRLSDAIEAFRSSVLGYREMGVQDCEAEVRIALAESLVAANRYREAESEIKSALPVLEASGLVAESLAAIVILRDSKRREMLDREASNFRD